MSRKIKNTEKLTALYCRLSLEDGRDNESMSISNQKAMLKDYAEKNGMTKVPPDKKTSWGKRETV